MKLRAQDIRKALPGLLLAAGLVLFVSAFGIFSHPGDAVSASRRVERRLSARMNQLSQFASEAMYRDPSLWQSERPVPEDMVIYRYFDDTLRSWVHQFSVVNDDISSKSVVQRLTNPRINLVSPLATLTPEPCYINLGPKWYLASMHSEGRVTVVAGLELANSLDTRRSNGVNPRLGLPERFSLHPLSSSGGAAVSLGGMPLFKVMNDTLDSGPTADGGLVWLALAFIVAAALCFLLRERNLRSFGIVSAGLVAVMTALYLWGRNAQGDLRIFSPTLYADGPVLWSLGAVLLVNLAITILAAGLYIVREDLYRWSPGGTAALLRGGILVVTAALVAAYSYVSLCSVIRNSNISLELYKLGDLSVYTALVYLSYIAMLMTIPLLLQMVRRRDVLTKAGCIVFSVLIALFLSILSASLGFRKESDKLEVWANRLAVERDIALEIQLRRVETQIAEDAVITALVRLENSEQAIRGRVMESYLTRLPQSYGVSVFLVRDGSATPESVAWLNARLQDAEAVSEGSRFFHSSQGGGAPHYTGVFLYYLQGTGLVRMLLCIDPLTDSGIKGYYSLLESSLPGKVFIPDNYSFARYKGRDLQVFRGDYAYSTRMPQRFVAGVYEECDPHIVEGGYSHFIYLISDDEAVIISRPVKGAAEYIVALLLIALTAYFLFILLLQGRDGGVRLGKRFYRRRITTVLMFFLIMTLVVMASVSMAFVYRRNNANLHTIMSSQVSSLQALVEYRIREAASLDELGRNDLVNILQRVSTNTKTDITLYSPDGRVFLSTTPGLFERMMLGSRMDEQAWRAIVSENKRFFIQREKIGSQRYYNMYAPLIGEDGALVAILCSPYAEKNYDFEMDAVMHSMTILVVFFILLIIAHITSSAVVDRMFRPLLEMGRKMASANLDSLEYIEYDRDDEISTLVSSYNRMVADLTESTRQLAQAERDKAWSGMARQVAHEIKNPLTPMKLQLQRIIRLKQKGDPSWQERFDEVAKVLLDHIDILTDTANEFSTFAKLYSEEPTRIDLDLLLQEELSMFDNKGEVTFDYMGLTGAEVTGPKPQLTRVFVNLLNNAVQALAGTEGARVVVSLRNSTREGYYDIVFEDNGPGVSSENVQKLFAPNFTTKSGGSGLGLAISRSILEKCSAEINYSRSFTLGGACFTITYPKN